MIPGASAFMAFTDPRYSDSANFNYIKEFVMDIDSEYLRGIPSDRKTGERYGLACAECFRYIGPATSHIDSYIEQNAVSF